MDFRNAYAQGFARVAACTLPVALADPATNAERILAVVKECHDEGVAVALFPELSLSGYAIDDLLMQDVLLEAVDDAVVTIAEATAKLLPLVVVGAPLRHGNRLYNCAVVIHRGEVLGVAPKSFLPNYREFYEKRWFASGAGHQGEFLVRPQWPGADVDGELPFGPDLIFTPEDLPDLAVHVEVCEDVWVPVPPSHEAALAGANVLLNLSASPITVGRAEDRHLLARSASARCNAAYLYAAASAGESSTDLSWDGMTMVYEMGALLGESERFPDGPRRTVVDVDLDQLRQERLRQGSFGDNADAYAADEGGFRVVPFQLRPPTGDLGLRRAVDRFPFVPDDDARLALDCYEAYNIQVSGLEQRMRAIGGGDPARMPTIVIGVSGGLDSTHALIVAAKACDRLGLPRTHILGFTMPGFATSAGTKSNAIHLMESLGITWEELDIRPAATQMLADLGHPFGRGEEVYDVTFENVQAGLRTDYLFRAANQRGGIVLGTGDLSELALGLVHLRRRRPDVALRRQHRGAEDVDAAPDSLGRLVGAVRGAGQRHAPRHPRHRDQPRAGAVEGGREDPVDRGLHRPLRPAGLHPLPRAAPRLPAEQDRVPRRARVVGRRAGRLAGRLPRRRAAGVRPRHHPALDGGVREAVLRQPVQALGHPQRPEGGGRRIALAARRLADAVRRRVTRLARRARRQRPAGLTGSRPGD